MRSGSDNPGASDARPGREELISGEMGPQELESQQAMLLGVLRRAAGAPVSYEQLRQAGIEFPASVASELELAGIDIEHCHLDGDSLAARHGGREPGLRLEPSPLDEAPTMVISLPPAVRLADQTVEPARRALTGMRERIAGLGSRMRARGATSDRLGGVSSVGASASAIRRWLAPVALIAAIAAIAVVLVVGLSSGGAAAPRSGSGASSKSSAAAGGTAGTHRHGHAGSTARNTGDRATATTPSSRSEATAPSTRQSKASPASQQTTPAQQQASEGATTEARRARRPRRSVASSGGTPAPASEASPELAAQYEAEGHGMLEGGQASAAIPVLSKALDATGEQPGNCLQPSSEACLTYAYALYDLGRALLLSGDASAAVPVLQRRLQIDNQREAVEAELAAARAQSG